jgi:Fe2+ transport system protein B
LPVYALFAAAFFPVGGQNVVFLLYLAGIGFAVLTGLILKYTLLKGSITPFVMELPPYHVPTVKSVLLRTWDRLKSFLLKASRILIPMVAILALLNTMSIDGTIGHDDSKESLLSTVSRTLPRWGSNRTTGPQRSAFSPGYSPRRLSSAPSMQSICRTNFKKSLPQVARPRRTA